MSLERGLFPRHLQLGSQLASEHVVLHPAGQLRHGGGGPVPLGAAERAQLSLPGAPKPAHDRVPGAGRAQRAVPELRRGAGHPAALPGRMESRRKAWEPLSEETVLAALDVILDRANYPLLVTCHLGRDRTGAVVGCLRKIQQWHLSSIFEEYRRFAGSKVRLQNEQFIELFDTDLVTIPANPPSWLRKH